MALAPLKLPKLQQGIAIVDPNTGRPSPAFVRYWNLDFIGAIERSVNDLTAVQAELAGVVSDLADTQADLAAAVADIQTLLGIASAQAEATQVAQAAANAAQATADAAGGGGTVSGSATDPAVDVFDETWVEGPQVDLTGVVAGDLTITGTGPQQDGDLALGGSGPFSGEFRVVEIDGATETTLYTIGFTVGAGPILNTGFAADVADQVVPLTTTGALSYRIDVRRLSGTATLSSLSLYIYARRAA